MNGKKKHIATNNKIIIIRTIIIICLLLIVPTAFAFLPPPYNNYLLLGFFAALAILGVLFILLVVSGVKVLHIKTIQKNKTNQTENAMPEKQINEQNEKMQSIGQLAGGIAHDFNNVLTAIIGLTDLLLSNHRPSDPSFPDIMNIKQEAMRAAALVKQLLAFSRRQTLRPQVLSIADTISDFRLLLNKLLTQDIKLELYHMPNLWPVKLDANQFERVIVNLCINARDAILATGRQGKISIKTFNAPIVANFNDMPKGDYVAIEIKDTGQGIKTSLLEKIFEPFFTTKQEGKGTGLGLSTVYGIVKQSGGFIYAKNVLQGDENSGAVFTIYFPRHHLQKTNSSANENSSINKNNETGNLSGSATIIFAEDEDSVRAIGTRTLSARGYKVFAAINGVEALQLLNEHKEKIDLIISDVVMPEMDGPTLLEQARQQGFDTPFIFASGYAEESFDKNLKEKYKEKFTFIAKPYNLKSLALIVRQTLEGKS